MVHPFRISSSDKLKVIITLPGPSRHHLSISGCSEVYLIFLLHLLDDSLPGNGDASKEYGVSKKKATTGSR